MTRELETQWDSLSLRTALENSQASDTDVQEALDNLTIYALQKITQEENPPVLSLTKAAQASGYFVRHSDIPQFFELLINAEVPVGHKLIKDGDKTQTYYFVATRHLERIKGIFDDDQELSRYRRNPVRYAFGPEQAEIPTTSELVFADSYRTPIHIFNDLGIKVGRKTFIKYAEFFVEDCPVTIFGFVSIYSHYYRSEYEDELRKYIEFRARQLGLLG